MKKIMMIGALLAAVFTTSAFAAATLATKDNGSSTGTKEGVDASGLTGNGAVVGGNGSPGTTSASPTDQTTSAGSRAALLHSLESPGNSNPSGLAKGNNGTTGNNGGGNH